MYDASMSDIDEDDDDDDDREVPRAPGKENEDPNKPSKLKATQSFIRKHGDATTKTSSDSSLSSGSEGGGVPLDMLKAMHLDADRARGLASSQSEHYRLSGGSYKPPSVESVPCVGDSDVDMQDTGAPAAFGGVASSARDPRPHHDQRSSSADKGCQTVPGSPARRQVSADEPTAAATNLHKKSVRWGKDLPTCPATAENNNRSAPQPHLSDSGLSSGGYRSDVSMRSARGRLRRPAPGEYTTGSPPARESTAVPAKGRDACLDDNNLGHKTSQQPRQGPQLNSNDYSAQYLPTSQGTFGGDGLSMPGSACGPTLSGYPGATNNTNNKNLPTPPESHGQPKGASTTGYFPDAVGSGDPDGLQQCGYSLDQQVPNFSRPYQSPKRGTRTTTTADSAYPVAETYHSSPGYGTRPDYVRQRYPHAYPVFSSATRFSDSTTRRDFSGYTAAPVGEESTSYQQYMDTLSSPDVNLGPGGYYGNYQPEYDVPFDGQGEQHEYHYYSGHHFSSHSPTAPPQQASSSSAFDFSYLDEGHKDTEPKFVRRNKTGNSSNNNTAAPATEYPTTTTPSRSQQQPWYLDEDAGANFEIYESGGGGGGGQQQQRDYQWHDGRTTLHQTSGGSSGGPSVPRYHDAPTGSNQPRNMVTILSIREITSDEELSGNDGNGKSHLFFTVSFFFLVPL